MVVFIKELHWKDKDPIENETDKAEQHKAHKVILGSKVVISPPNHGFDLANRIE